MLQHYNTGLYLGIVLFILKSLDNLQEIWVHAQGCHQLGVETFAQICLGPLEVLDCIKLGYLICAVHRSSGDLSCFDVILAKLCPSHVANEIVDPLVEDSFLQLS